MDDRKVIAFKERAGNGIGGKGIIFKQDTCFTLPTCPDAKICYEVQVDDGMTCFRKSCKPGKDGCGEKWVQDEVCNTLNTFENTSVRTTLVICFIPKTANCTEYKEDDKSATLTLGYHYGGERCSFDP